MKSRNFEVGIAGCLGALTGLMVGYAFGWQLWLCPLIGAVAVFLLYKPREVLASASDATAIVIEAAKHSSISSLSHKAFDGIAFVLFAIALVATVLIGFFVFPIVYLNLGLPYSERLATVANEGFVLTVFCTGAWTTTFGIKLLELSLSIKKHTGQSWMFPIYRRQIHRFAKLVIGSNSNEKEFLQFYKRLRQEANALNLLWYVFWAISVIFCASVIFFICLLILLLDLAFTIILACASTKRLAAMTGATIGSAVGAMLIASGFSFGPATLIATGLVGYLVGPAILVLREKLSANTLVVAT